jgi:hypothetical protein
MAGPDSFMGDFALLFIEHPPTPQPDMVIKYRVSALLIKPSTP